MAERQGRPRTVKVICHIGRGEVVAVGLVTQEWNGAVRVDRRLGSAQPVAGPLPARPRGVPEDLWLVYVALGQRLAALERAAQGTP